MAYLVLLPHTGSRDVEEPIIASGRVSPSHCSCHHQIGIHGRRAPLTGHSAETCPSARLDSLHQLGRCGRHSVRWNSKLAQLRSSTPMKRPTPHKDL
jgi:hypothetical protein